VAIKPTPSKLVLLMSAAGLGLSWSGVALATRDSHAPASVALTFGVAARVEPRCDTQSADAWAFCPASHGDLVKTIVAETAALPLPLPLATAGYASNARLTFRTLDIDAAENVQRADETRSADDPPAPHDQVPPPETPVAPRGVDDSTHDRKADAITMVWLDDPQDIADTAPPVAVPVVRVHTSMSAAASNSSVDADHRAVRPERNAQAAAVEGAEGAAADDWTSIDRVFASLAEVLGAQLDAPTLGIEVKPDQTAATGKQVFATVSEAALRVTAAPAVAEHPTQGVVQASPGAATLDEGAAILQRSSKADDIVVASSHTDKILMSLEALRSGESLEPGRRGAQTNKTVVVRHTDKVLETLALFQSKKPKRTAWACTGAPDQEARVARRSKPHPAWVFGEPSAAEPALAGMGLEPDILLDLQLSVADRLEQPALLAAPTQAGPRASPVAVPHEHSAIGSDLVALNADQLDEVRGGFVTDGGLKISFGIERAVYLNGTLVTTTSLNIADLSKISGGQAQVTGNGTAGSLAVLQSGVGNVFAPGSVSATAAGTVIQNTLDGQKINTITRIDAVINSSGIMRSMNLQSSMQSAIVNSLRR